MKFDQSDPKNLGRSLYFDLDAHIAAVISMIRSDEIEMALKMLDQVPAWHRENYPPELQKIKDTLYKNLYDPFEYASDADEAGWTKEDAESQFLTAYTFPRAEILLELVTDLNRRGERPWLCELSTSHGLLPLGLSKQGRSFDFFGKNLNHAALVKLKGWLATHWQERPNPHGQKTIFVFCEALEHCYREEDLLNSYMKLGVDFDYIVLSVPNGCLGGGLPDWDTRRLGHLRGYNAAEFSSLAQRYFKGYEWYLYKSVSLVLVGRKPSEQVSGSKDGELLK